MSTKSMSKSNESRNESLIKSEAVYRSLTRWILGDFLLVQARWAKTNRGDAESSYVSAPFRVSEKSKTKCLKFQHLMRAEPSASQKSRKKTNYPPLSMQLKVNILTSDKKTSEKPYTIWSREEAINGDQWIETNLNLLEELNELRPKKGRRVGRRKVTFFIIKLVIFGLILAILAESDVFNSMK